jgi:hypothetical protein
MTIKSMKIKLISITIIFFMSVLSDKADALSIKGYFPVHQGNFWNYTQTEEKVISTWAINGTFYYEMLAGME